MKVSSRRLAALAVSAAVLTSTAALAGAPAEAAGAGACGSAIRPVLQFDGLGHFIITVGFTGAKRAVAYSFTEYVEVDNNGSSTSQLHTQHGTLLFRSSLTKRHIETLPPGETSVTVTLGGTYAVAGNNLPCAVTGFASGGYR